MKNKYVGDFRDDFMELVLKKDEVSIRLKRIEEQNREGRLSNEYYKENVEKAKREYAIESDLFKEKLNKTRDKYINHLDQWTTLNSEKINADNKILESGLPLTAEDYRKLEDKNSTNYTMLSLIRNHAKERKIHYPVAVNLDKKEKLQAFDSILKTVKDAERTLTVGKTGYISSLWTHDGMFEKTYSREIQQLDFQWYK